MSFDQILADEARYNDGRLDSAIERAVELLLEDPQFRRDAVVAYMDEIADWEPTHTVGMMLDCLAQRHLNALRLRPWQSEEALLEEYGIELE